MITYKNSEIFLSEEENKAPEYIQIIRAGKFDDYWTGKFEVSKDMLRSMKKSFDDNVRKIDLAIDFAHMNHLEAAGWIKEIELRKDDSELWAKVEWTELGKQKVEKKLYRYLSAEFDTQYKDNESGKEFGCVLLGAGLTNRPFVKNMKPTTNLAEEKIMEEKIKTLEESNVKLSEEIKNLQDSIKKLSDEKEEIFKENENLKNQIETTNKENEFQKMLSEGKVIPAQKEAWMKGDLVEFASKANKTELNLNEKGSGKNSEEDVKDEEALLVEAKKLAEKDNISESEATSILLDKPEFKHLNK